MKKLFTVYFLVIGLETACALLLTYIAILTGELKKGTPTDLDISKMYHFVKNLHKSFATIKTGLDANKYDFQCECWAKNWLYRTYGNTKCKKGDEEKGTPSTYAYVNMKKLNAIHFCPAYFDGGIKQDGIMGHEFSHFFLKTTDEHHEKNLKRAMNLTDAQFYEAIYGSGSEPVNLFITSIRQWKMITFD